MQIPDSCTFDGRRSVQALKKWHTEQPKSFVKRVYIQPGLDI